MCAYPFSMTNLKYIPARVKFACSDFFGNHSNRINGSCSVHHNIIAVYSTVVCYVCAVSATWYTVKTT